MCVPLTGLGSRLDLEAQSSSFLLVSSAREIDKRIDKSRLDFIHAWLSSEIAMIALHSTLRRVVGLDMYHGVGVRSCWPGLAY